MKQQINEHFELGNCNICRATAIYSLVNGKKFMFCMNFARKDHNKKLSKIKVPAWSLV